MNQFDSASSAVGTATDEVQICAPGNLKGARNAPTSALLSWDEPYSTCKLCPDAIGYEVFGEGIQTRSVTRPPVELTGLNPDSEYLLYVKAIAANNNISQPGPLRLFKFKLLAPTRPGPLELSDLTSTSVKVSWTPSTDNGGDIRYRVFLNDFLIKQTAQPYVLIAHLQNHSDYRVKVLAINAAGSSEPVAIAFKTRLRPPTNLRFSHFNGICRLAWDPLFKKRPTHEISINGKNFTAAPGRWGYNFKLSDLSSGPAPHHFKFAVHARLDGDSSEVMTLEATLADTIPPSQPGAPVVTDVTDTSAKISWEPSSDNAAVTGYRITLNGFLVFSSPDTEMTFNSLTPGAYHYVFVRARDKEGNLSQRSPISVFKTTGQAPAPGPNAPTVSISALGSSSASLEWEFSEGDSATGVRILKDDEHLKDVLFIQSIHLNNLIPDTEYKISVSAFDIYGQLSEPTVIVYEPRDLIPPSTPGNLRKMSSTLDSVTLAWDESTDDVGICDYVIYNNQQYFDRTPLTHYTAVDLTPGTYSFEVCALDLSGNHSAPASARVEIEGAP
ncbi:hypothetical protein ACVWYU_003116 [Pseudomonas sp. TE12234]